MRWICIIVLFFICAAQCSDMEALDKRVKALENPTEQVDNRVVDLNETDANIVVSE